MATIKAKVIGQCAVGGVAPGGTVDLDPALVNVDALVYAEHVELTPEPKPKSAAKKAAPKKGDA